MTLTGKTKSKVVPAGHGFAFELNEGASCRIIDSHGAQVVDFMAWVVPYSPLTSCEHFSASYTRWGINSLAPPAVGQYLLTNRARKMFEITDDTVKVHDMSYMACNPATNILVGMPDARSCASNMAEAMNGYLRDRGDETRMEWHQVHDPFNIFQNTPYYSMRGWMNPSKPGDYIQLKAQMNVIVSLSSCPYAEGGFNGGESTDVEVVWEVSE